MLPMLPMLPMIPMIPMIPMELLALSTTPYPDHSESLLADKSGGA